MFNFRDYNLKFLEIIRLTRNPMHNAKSYNVQLLPVNNVAQGEMYWRVIGIHHLLPLENMGNHHVYLDALDENGNRVNPPAWIGWTWEGRRPTERADPQALDKPPNEPGTNIAMNSGQVVSVWVRGTSRDSNDKSDSVRGISTLHPDEPLPDGRLLNTLGHHSFYVVFQRTRKGVQPPDPQIPPVVTPKTLEERVGTLELQVKVLNERITQGQKIVGYY